MKKLLVFGMLWIDEVQAYIYSSWKKIFPLGMLFSLSEMAASPFYLNHHHHYNSHCGVFTMVFDTSSKLWGVSHDPQYSDEETEAWRGDWVRKRWSWGCKKHRDLRTYVLRCSALIIMCLPQSPNSGVTSVRPSSSLSPPHFVTWAFRALNAQP